jgi:hypothetical protein
MRARITLKSKTTEIYLEAEYPIDFYQPPEPMVGVEEDFGLGLPDEMYLIDQSGGHVIVKDITVMAFFLGEYYDEIKQAYIDACKNICDRR